MFRKDLVEMLSHGPISVAEIARRLEAHPKDIEQDIKHLLKSLKRSVYRLAIIPAQCRKCSFTFQKEKLRKPGKCPVCHGTWIEEPRIEVEDKGRKKRGSHHSPVNRWGAIFDWDGVVIDSFRQHREGWSRLATEEAKPMPPDAFERGFGMTNDQIISEILRWTTDIDAIERLSRRKEVLYRDLLQETAIQPLPGVTHLLGTLERASVPCAIASSTERENIDAVLNLLGLHEYFDAIVSADDVSRGKPDPEVFLLAAERLAMPPARCVVFEDAIVGIEAGHAAGMKVVAVSTTNPASSLRIADRVVQRLDELNLSDLAKWF